MEVPATTEKDSARGSGLPLADGAHSQWDSIPPEIENQRRLASNPDCPLEQRLEAYEDIVDSEVGDTQLIRARNMERLAGFRQLYVKFEGGNPTGTQKDRIAFAQAMDALRRGFDTLSLATCGNYGVAAAVGAALAGLRCVVYIPEKFRTKRIEEMSEYGAEIRRVAGDYETAVAVSRQQAETEDWYDANPGGANVALQLQAYGQIAYEIYDELRDAPAVVAAPVSNGTTLAGIYHGFRSLYRRGKTSHLPKIVAGSSFRKNPIVAAFLGGLRHCEDLLPERIRETAINEPLINWHSIDGNHALDAIYATAGWAAHASDKTMLSFTRTLRQREGLSVLPASTAGLIALVQQHNKQPFPGDRYVALLTGRNS